MVAFIIGLVGVLACPLLLWARSAIKPDPDRRDYHEALETRTVVAVAAAILGLIGAFVIFWDSFTIVPARNVGVVNTFGKANEALDNGWHWVAPWSSVETIDATVRTLRLNQGDHTCVTVRLANQTTACVDATVQWNVSQQANANELWQRYRGTNDDVVGNVQANVIERQLQRAFNFVFEEYNPLAVLTGATVNVKTDDLAAKALVELRSHVDPGITVDSVVISIVHFDQTTQDKLNGYAQALADTQIATQAVKTAAQRKLANDTLAASRATNDPGVLYQNCLNLIADLAARGQLGQLPPTFSCASAGQVPVIIGGAR